MTVYVVTSGEYSAYSIDGVFSTEEKAKEFMGNAPEGSYTIEPYDLDSQPSRVYGSVWVESLTLDGTRVQCWENEGSDLTDEHIAGERGHGDTAAGFYDDRRLTGQDHGWFTGTSYISREHAFKLAVEQRQKALREHPDYFIPPTAQELQDLKEKRAREYAEWKAKRLADHSYPQHV